MVTHTHACTHTCMHAHTHARTHTHTCTTNTNAHTHYVSLLPPKKHVHTHTHTHTHTHSDSHTLSLSLLSLLITEQTIRHSGAEGSVVWTVHCLHHCLTWVSEVLMSTAPSWWAAGIGKLSLVPAVSVYDWWTLGRPLTCLSTPLAPPSWPKWAPLASSA